MGKDSFRISEQGFLISVSLKLGLSWKYLPMALTRAKAIPLVSASIDPKVDEAKDRDVALAAQRPAAMITNMAYRTVKSYTVQTTIDVISDTVSQPAMTIPRQSGILSQK